MPAFGKLGLLINIASRSKGTINNFLNVPHVQSAASLVSLTESAVFTDVGQTVEVR